MRNMSFALTTKQFCNRTKDVTRRLGWEFLKNGDVIMACVKCMGLKTGEKIQKLGIIRIISVRREPLYLITQADVKREGFPELTPTGFITMFCNEMKVEPDEIITRIEFSHIAPPLDNPLFLKG